MAYTFLTNGAGYPVARDIMKTKLVTLAPDRDVFEGVKLLIKHKISGAPVVDKDRKLLGVFSEESVMKVMVVADYNQIPSNRVDAYMELNPPTVDENTILISLAQMFLTEHCRRLPVLSDGILVGQVSRRDVIQAAMTMAQKSGGNDKQLLYLSALRKMSDAPEVG